jgi:hypothetical protein
MSMHDLTESVSRRGSKLLPRDWIALPLVGPLTVCLLVFIRY